MDSSYSISRPCPRSINVGGKNYAINLSFDRVLEAVKLLSGEEFDQESALDILYDWFVADNRKASMAERIDVVNEIISKLINFDKSAESDDEHDTISYSQDAPYIYAAFLQAYGIDLFKEQGYMQWWCFLSLLKALPEDTRLMQIVEIRSTPVPPPNKHNGKYIEKLTKLKTIYAIRDHVNPQKAEEGWNKLFAILEQKANE